MTAVVQVRDEDVLALGGNAEVMRNGQIQDIF